MKSLLLVGSVLAQDQIELGLREHIEIDQERLLNEVIETDCQQAPPTLRNNYGDCVKAGTMYSKNGYSQIYLFKCKHDTSRSEYLIKKLGKNEIWNEMQEMESENAQCPSANVKEAPEEKTDSFKQDAIVNEAMEEQTDPLQQVKRRQMLNEKFAKQRAEKQCGPNDVHYLTNFGPIAHATYRESLPPRAQIGEKAQVPCKTGNKSVPVECTFFGWHLPRQSIHICQCNNAPLKSEFRGYTVRPKIEGTQNIRPVETIDNDVYVTYECANPMFDGKHRPEGKLQCIKTDGYAKLVVPKEQKHRCALPENFDDDWIATYGNTLSSKSLMLKHPNSQDIVEWRLYKYPCYFPTKNRTEAWEKCTFSESQYMECEKILTCPICPHKIDEDMEEKYDLTSCNENNPPAKNVWGHRQIEVKLKCKNSEKMNILVFWAEGDKVGQFIQERTRDDNGEEIDTDC